MTSGDRRNSVVPMPPDEGEQRAIDAARDALAPPPAQRERLRRRLESVEPAVAHRRARQGRRRLVLRGALAAALLAVVWFARPLYWPGETQVEGSSPALSVVTSRAEVQTLQPERWLEIEVHELTTLDVSRSTGGEVALVLHEGEIDMEVDPGRGDRRVRVLAGPVTVQVTGTRFTVSRRNDQVGVSVQRGSVVVRWPSGETVLAEGGRWQSWDPSTGRIVNTREPLLIDTNVPGDADVSIDDESAAAGFAAPQEVSSGHPSSGPTEDGTPALASPTAVEAGDSLALAPPGPLDPEAVLLSRIAVQRGAGVPAKDRLEDIERFLAEHPASSSHEEVLAMQVEALAASGADLDALDASRRFLDRYPSSERRQEIRWIEATVARDRLEDCERALPAYRKLADNIGPRQAEALFYQGICAADLGLDEEARDTLSRALDLGLDPNRAGVAGEILSKQ